MKKKYIFFILIGLFLIISDQFVKYLISNIGNIEIINNFLEFYYVKNDGVAFGLFGGNIIFIIIITLILICYLIYDLINNTKRKLQYISYLLIISGALGNLIDRIYFNYVRDFISFKIFNIQMAIFNLADIYITFGVILFIYNLLKEGSNNERINSRK